MLSGALQGPLRRGILSRKLNLVPLHAIDQLSMILSRPVYFKSDGPMMETKMWRPWRQCISPKCLKSHLCPNGPSTECSRSVTTVTYAYRVVGILRDDKQRRNRSHRKSNCKSFNLGKSRLELRTKSQCKLRVQEINSLVFFCYLNFFFRSSYPFFLFYVTTTTFRRI